MQDAARCGVATSHDLTLVDVVIQGNDECGILNADNKNLRLRHVAILANAGDGITGSIISAGLGDGMLRANDLEILGNEGIGVRLFSPGKYRLRDFVIRDNGGGLAVAGPKPGVLIVVTRPAAVRVLPSQRMRYFYGSFLVTALGLAAGAALGWEIHGTVQGALTTVFIVTVLGILEVSLSFDNAVVNATVLQRMDVEVLDASFSFDGVIGAFALSTNLFIIAIGLGIGAMFVRSLTIMLVDQGTLTEYRYLEHGAFYAIIALGVIMFLKTICTSPRR